MKSDWQTVTENKQMQQSVTLAFFFPLDASAPARSACLPLPSGVDGAPPRALSWRSALVLDCQPLSLCHSLDEGVDVLEFVRAPLPFPSQLHAHLDAAVHVLVATLIVHSKL